MSHFNVVANDWDSKEKVQLMKELADKTKEKLRGGENLDILDFGCGTGLFGFEFIDRAKSITGVDTSSGMLEVFDKKASCFSNIHSVNIDLEKEKLQQKFDLIISSMAFHHLENPGEMIVTFSKMLNKNGQIAIVDLDQEDGTFHPNNKEMGVKHFGFSKEETEEWAKMANLDVTIQKITFVKKNDRNYFQFLAIFEQKKV